MDGQPVKSCTVLAAMCDGHEIRTVESLEADGELDPIQQGFHECHGLQCGFCTPGMLMTTRKLLDDNPDPSETEIREAISGQICRCTGYENIVQAVRWAAENEAGVAEVDAEGSTHSAPAVESEVSASRPPNRPPTRAPAIPPPTSRQERPRLSARPGTRSGSGACSARRTPASCAARATTSTTSSSRACCTGRSSAARSRTPA